MGSVVRVRHGHHIWPHVHHSGGRAGRRGSGGHLRRRCRRRCRCRQVMDSGDVAGDAAGDVEHAIAKMARTTAPATVDGTRQLRLRIPRQVCPRPPDTSSATQPVGSGHRDRLSSAHGCPPARARNPTVAERQAKELESWQKSEAIREPLTYLVTSLEQDRAYSSRAAGEVPARLRARDTTSSSWAPARVGRHASSRAGSRTRA